MKKRGISKYLQIKIKKYLEYMFEESKMNYKETLLLTQSLSQSLKEECFYELYGQFLKKHKVFSQFSDPLLNKLTNYFYEVSFAPDDIFEVLIMKIKIDLFRMKKMVTKFCILF